MRDEITKITLNDELTDLQEFCGIIKKVVSDKNILAEKGGYVFKAYVKDSHLYFGLMPGIIGDRKIYHYDVILPVESIFTLSGSFNAKGGVTILFAITKDQLEKISPKELEGEVCNNAIRLALFFVTHGVPGNIELDTATQLFLKNSGLFSAAPTTLGELAEG